MSYDYGRHYRGGHEPIFVHNRWQHRGEGHWLRDRENEFVYRRDHVSTRPPRTWRALNRLSSQDRDREHFRVVESYERMERGIAAKDRTDGVNRGTVKAERSDRSRSNGARAERGIPARGAQRESPRVSGNLAPNRVNGVVVSRSRSFVVEPAPT